MKPALFLLALMIYACNVIGQTAQQYFEKGIVDYQKEKYLAATRAFNKAIQLKPDYAEAYKARGDAKVMNPNSSYNSAISDYSKAIELDPDNAIAYSNRGFVKHLKRDFQGALEDFNKAITISPDYVQAYRKRADTKKKLDDYQGAQEDNSTADRIEQRLLADKKAREDNLNRMNESSAAEGSSESIVRNSNGLRADLSSFKYVQKDINYAGVQLLNARRTFVAGFILNLAGGILATSAAYANSNDVRLGLGISGGIITVVGGVVMLTAVIPIGGAGKILKKVEFPTNVPVYNR